MTDTKLIPPDADARAVSTLLDLGEVRRRRWDPGELGEMLRHQLGAPMYLGLGVLSGEVVHQLREAAPALDPLMSLNQLFHLSEPPLELLRLVKRFTRICRGDPENPLPGEIVMLLYYLSIAVAMTRCGQRISGLQTGPLRRGLRWVCGQSWVDQDTRDLVADASARLDDKAGGTSSAITPG